MSKEVMNEESSGGLQFVQVVISPKFIWKNVYVDSEFIF